jgi:hypothetical protein
MAPAYRRRGYPRLLTVHEQLDEIQETGREELDTDGANSEG